MANLGGSKKKNLKEFWVGRDCCWRFLKNGASVEFLQIVGGERCFTWSSGREVSFQWCIDVHHMNGSWVLEKIDIYMIYPSWCFSFFSWILRSFLLVCMHHFVEKPGRTLDIIVWSDVEGRDIEQKKLTISPFHSFKLDVMITCFSYFYIFSSHTESFEILTKSIDWLGLSSWDAEVIMQITQLWKSFGASFTACQRSGKETQRWGSTRTNIPFEKPTETTSYDDTLSQVCEI